jgi:hypothetical protein
MSPTSYQAAPPRARTSNIRWIRSQVKVCAPYPAPQTDTKSPCSPAPFRIPRAQCAPAPRDPPAPPSSPSRASRSRDAVSPSPLAFASPAHAATAARSCCIPHPAARTRVRPPRSRSRRFDSSLHSRSRSPPTSRRSRRPDTRPHRRASPRCAAADCTSQRDRCATRSPS